MAGFRLSKLAQLDLIEIADYTIDAWVFEQAYRYLESLDHCFNLLATNPGIGHPCGQIRRGYRRMEHKKHVVFYRPDVNGILVSRILHERMLPGKQVFEDI